MKFLGCDCGKKGAIALLDTEDSKPPTILDTKLNNWDGLDVRWFADLLVEQEPDYAIIEQCFRPNSLVRMEGQFLGALETLYIPTIRIPVVTWKTAIIGKNTSDKDLSIQWAQRLFPDADLNRLSPKQKKLSLNADRSEALLLAVYLQRTLSPNANGN